MHISVISDTHGTLDSRALTALEGSDLILHAGDIGGPFILEELETIAPVVAVLGNCDWAEYGPEVNTSWSGVVEGVRIFMAHTPQDAGAPCDKRYPAAGERGGLVPAVFARARWNWERDLQDVLFPHLVIHGHTHVPRRETVNGVTVLNPGSASRAKGGVKGPSVACFDVQDGALENLRVIYL